MQKLRMFQERNTIINDLKLKLKKEGWSISCAKAIGWSVTALTEESRIWIDNLDIDKSAFDAVRKMPIQIKKKAEDIYLYMSYL